MNKPKTIRFNYESGEFMLQEGKSLSPITTAQAKELWDEAKHDWSQGAFQRMCDLVFQKQ